MHFQSKLSNYFFFHFQTPRASNFLPSFSLEQSLSCYQLIYKLYHLLFCGTRVQEADHKIIQRNQGKIAITVIVNEKYFYNMCTKTLNK